MNNMSDTEGSEELKSLSLLTLKPEVAPKPKEPKTASAKPKAKPKAKSKAKPKAKPKAKLLKKEPIILTPKRKLKFRPRTRVGRLIRPVSRALYWAHELWKALAYGVRGKKYPKNRADLSEADLIEAVLSRANLPR